MTKTRVLAVDDSVPMLRILAKAIGRDPELEVVATAGTGREALLRVVEVRPDAITLDVEMPELDGLETLLALRRTGSRTPVVMFSSLTERGAKTTIQALLAGASDYVMKPASSSGFEETVERVHRELAPRLRALVGKSPAGAMPSATLCTGARGQSGAAEGAPSSSVAALGGKSGRGDGGARVEVVAIGASTGGPSALSVALGAMPTPPRVPILVVQHMPPLFTRLLAERLARQVRFPVREAVHGEPLEPGVAWLAPGDYHLEVERQGGRALAVLHQGAHESSCRPAANVLFRSVAAAYGGAALGVVLTGMGSDGLRGAEAIRSAGGKVLVQDEASSVVWGMPGAVAHAGLADETLAPAEIGRVLALRVCGDAGSAEVRVR